MLRIVAAARCFAVRLAARARGRAGCRERLSQSRDPHRRAVPGRRAGRCRRAAAGAADERGLGPAGDRRQPARRQHRDRRAAGREGRARRLHAADGDRLHAGDEPVPLQVAALRPDQRFRADHHHDQDRVGAGGVRRDRPEVGEGADRQGQGRARHAELRRRHHHRAADGLPLPQGGRPRHRLCAVQGHARRPSTACSPAACRSSTPPTSR